MKIQTTILAVAFALLFSCGESKSPVSVTGRYHVDKDQFSKMVAGKLIEGGQASESMRETLVGKLKGSSFDLDLAPDGTFTATQSVLTDTRRYKGKWVQSGSTFTLDQTHDNGEPVEDRMTGTLVDGKLDLRQAGGEGIRVVLYHEQAAAPGR